MSLHITSLNNSTSHHLITPHHITCVTPQVDLVAHVLLLAAAQNLVLQPLSIALCELGSSLEAVAKTESRVRGGQIIFRVLRSLLKNPMILSILAGAIFNRAWPPAPAPAVASNIPRFLDNLLLLCGNVFPFSALFLNGMAVVGKFKLLVITLQSSNP